MVFSSMVFLCIFLPVVFLLHLILPGIRAKNWMLLLASLVFYAYGEPVYVLLMIASAFVNYLSALLIEKKPSGKKAVMTINVILNLGVLVLFKYTGFLAESFNAILARRFRCRPSGFPSEFPFSPSRPCPTSSTFTGA